jgi:glycosyltransferase involved in cell wall biosynthesis
MEAGRRLRVVCLTSKNNDHNLTWHLRVECMLPYLREHGIDVDTVRLPRGAAGARMILAELQGYDVAWIHRRTFGRGELSHLRRVARHLILDIDDPVHLSPTRLFNFSLNRWLRFRATTRACSAVMAASHGLVADARRYNANVHLVPLCADPAVYSMIAKRRPATEPLRLLWLGSKSTFRYLVHASKHLERVGACCPGVELTVVGHSVLRLKNLAVRNVSWSAEADRTALDRCHVGLVPMVDDRWTRSKAALKPLQYLASGIPFVGTPVGIVTHLADGGRNGLLAKTPDEWAQAVRQLRDDEDLRFAMGTHGVDYVRRNHSSELLSERIAGIFNFLSAETSIPA